MLYALCLIGRVTDSIPQLEADVSAAKLLVGRWEDFDDGESLSDIRIGQRDSLFIAICKTGESV